MNLGFIPFEISKSTFVLQALESISLPPFKGSTLRGGFGYAFKRATCVLKSKTCESCLLKETCPYSYVFETPTPANSDIMRKYPKAPHPFVLEPPETEGVRYSPGDRIQFDLVLIGKAIGYLPYFIYSFEIFGQTGIGRGKGRFSLREVRTGSSILSRGPGGEIKKPSLLVYDGEQRQLQIAPSSMTWNDLMQGSTPSARIMLCFKTPTRIRYDNHYVRELEFHILMRNLLRRISTLSYFHCGQTLDVDYRSLIENANGVTIEDRSLKWFDWQRYSGRQGTHMKMGGFVGSITFRGDLEPFWPFLALGQHIHVGKGTSFGLGRYEIHLG
jgi:CRISPR-associated endoribonuclease Cas6